MSPRTSSAAPGSMPQSREIWSRRHRVASWIAVLLVSATPGLAQTPSCHAGSHTTDEAAPGSGVSPKHSATKSAAKANPSPFDDPPLLDQDGQPVRFYRDLALGKTVAVNFVFTTCTTICPPMGAAFGKLQRLLGERAGKEIFLVSVSIDPAADTPHRLKAWGRSFGAGSGWTLVTGSKPDVDRLLKSLGVFTADKTRHGPILLLGDGSGERWQRANAFAPPAQILADLDRLAGAAKSRQANAQHHPPRQLGATTVSEGSER